MNIHLILMAQTWNRKSRFLCTVCVINDGQNIVKFFVQFLYSKLKRYKKHCEIFLFQSEKNEF